MLKFMSFSSGSCGNCYYLGDEEKALIIDAGVSPKKVAGFLRDNGLDIKTIVGILVTHDHWDHIRSLSSLARKFKTPIYSSKLIHMALTTHPYISDHVTSFRKDLNPDEENDICGIKVRYFKVPHDATQTVGYAIEFEGHKFVIMTDLGVVTEEAMNYASQADTLVIESNFDVDMLLGGSYPYDLKMRIMHGNGHLSNDACAQALKQACHSGLRNVFLCHLSENNNTPEKAYEACANAISSLGIPEGTVMLRCLPRTYPSPLFNL